MQFLQLEKLIESVNEMVGIYGLKVLGAIAILIIGRWVAGIFKRIMEKILINRNVDPMITSFVGSLTYIGLIVFIVLAALGQVGIQTTSFVAVIGAAGLAIGLALQGSLSNFAAGFLLIIFRPFKLGDFIEGGGGTGTVEKIQIFTTQLKTPDNKTLIIPNSSVMSNNITNWTTKGTRRVDMVFGIGYDDDIDKAKEIIAGVIQKDERVLKDPETTIIVLELGDSSVNIGARPWVNSSDYWGVLSTTLENVKKAFDKAGISIPYPQQDVHIINHKSEDS